MIPGDANWPNATPAARSEVISFDFAGYLNPRVRTSVTSLKLSDRAGFHRKQTGADC
jgi:hypothetical protein